MSTYRVKQGDCICSIADKNGLFWETVWNHPDNAQLKQDRKDPNILSPGDEVFVPEKKAEPVACATDTKHRFRRLGVPAKMKLRFLINDEPRANAQYRLYVDSKLISEGATDGDGYIEESIMPTAKKGKIVIVDRDNNEERYEFKFGSVDPLDTEDGVKKRLFNLGLDVSDLPRAISEFQQQYALEATQAADDATKSKLREVFGQ